MLAGLKLAGGRSPLLRLAATQTSAFRSLLSAPGDGVPVGTPRPDWKRFGYETRCASVVKVSDFAIRRVKPVSLPIVLGSTFELEDCAHGARLHEKKEQPYADADGYVYNRWGSPTNEGAARQVAALEGIGPEHEGGCMLFSSGMAAISGALMSALKAGDHAVLPYTVYGGTHEFLVEFLRHWKVEYTLVDSTDAANYAAALRPNTRVVYTETPANPTCRLTDLEAVAAVVDTHFSAQRASAGAEASSVRRPLVMCDSTFATPFHQRCLEIAGVDVSIHSATKYIGGHSDILAGAVTAKSAAVAHEIAKVQKEADETRAAESGAGSEVRLCFAYLNNNGQCSRGAACKFRHVEPDHPDAIADRVKTGHVSKLAGILPAEKVRVAH